MANNYENELKQLRREFGNNIDQDGLIAVLEMLQGDVQAAIGFLQAGNDDYVENPNADGLPQNFFQKPEGHSFDKLKEIEPEKTAAQELKSFILSENSTFLEHYKKQCEETYADYLSVILMLINNGVALSNTTKTKILACAFARKDRELEEYLLNESGQFGFPEILRSLKILDAPRKARALEKRLERLQKQNTAKPRTLGRIRNKIHDAKQDFYQNKNNVGDIVNEKFSVNGALCRRIRKWLKKVKEDKLTFFALQMPKQSWVDFADIVHCSPSDFVLDWFLGYCFGDAPPENSMVKNCMDLNEDNVDDLIDEFDIPYSYLRTKLPVLSPHIKSRVCEYEPLDLVIWYYEELSGTKQVDNIISQRLENGQEPLFSYGKFMERLLYFKQQDTPFYKLLIPIAEKRLHQINLPLEPPVVVLGDKSYYIDVAIRFYTIIDSLLTSICSADLRFFNVETESPESMPETVEEVIDVALNTQADGLTAPACSILECLNTNEVVKTFIVVTDEIENEPVNSTFFAQAFYQYYTTVYPSKIVFVSFLEDPSKKGRMVRALEEMGITPLQFRLNAMRPDLTKLDTLFGILSSESQAFSSQVDTISNFYEVEEHSISDLLNDIKELVSLSDNNNNNNDNASDDEEDLIGG